eukprot:2766029-Alexandrium_andersonii.AAC.1
MHRAMLDAGELEINPHYVGWSDTFPPDLVGVVDRMSAWSVANPRRRHLGDQRQHLGVGCKFESK